MPASPPRAFAVPLLCLLACATPAPHAPDLTTLTQQVMEAELAFAHAMAERDHDAFVRLLADDAVFFTEGEPLRGKAPVAEGWRRYFTSPEAPFSWAPTQIEVAASGTLALSSGPVYAPNGSRTGTFNSVWRQEAPGVWRVVFDKGAPAPDAPARSVAGTTLTSENLPTLRIDLDPAFHFVGTVPFRIRDVAEGERFVFADTHHTPVRLVIAQFESILPTADVTFDYSFEGAPEEAGYRFRQNPYAFSHAEAVAQDPAGDAARTFAFLRRRGYDVEDEVMMIRRLTVPDAARKHELILFYVEPLAPTGIRLAQLYRDDAPTPLWDSLAAALATRAAPAYTIRALDSN